MCCAELCVHGPEPLPGRGEWLVCHCSWWRCTQRAHSHAQADPALDGVCGIVLSPAAPSRGLHRSPPPGILHQWPGLRPGLGGFKERHRWFQMVWPRYAVVALISLEHLMLWALIKIFLITKATELSSSSVLISRAPSLPRASLLCGRWCSHPH